MLYMAHYKISKNEKIIERGEKMGILKKINLAKIIIRQGNELVERDNLIKQLKEENESNREEITDLNNTIYKYEKLADVIETNLFKLQDISDTGLNEKDKDIHRNVIINRIIKELSSTRKSTR